MQFDAHEGGSGRVVRAPRTYALAREWAPGARELARADAYRKLRRSSSLGTAHGSWERRGIAAARDGAERGGFDARAAKPTNINSERKVRVKAGRPPAVGVMERVRRQRAPQLPGLAADTAGLFA